MRLMAVISLAAAVGTGAWAQRRDFLTEDEVQRVREAQEPNERLAQYLVFARLRLELVRQTIAVEKAGRSKLIHDKLEDYTRIIEAIDTVIDDGLARKLDLTKGVALVAQQEKEFLGVLKEFAARPARDAYLFDFALKDAVETTQESLEEARHDAKERAHRVLEEDARDKKKREAAMTTAELDERKKEEKKAAEKDKKAPTLKRKSEIPK